MNRININNISEPAKCTMCVETSVNVRNLQRHQANAHKEKYRRHQRNREERPFPGNGYECDICGLIFGTKNDRVDHKENHEVR